MRVSITRSAMLKPAERSAKPIKYAQNMCAGIHAGTPWEIAREFVRCSAPNTASGTAKKIGPNTITFSSPLAARKDFLAAYSPLTRVTRPANHSQKIKRDNTGTPRFGASD